MAGEKPPRWRELRDDYGRRARGAVKEQPTHVGAYPDHAQEARQERQIVSYPMGCDL